MADLDDELRGANPLATRRTSPLSPRAQRELSELLATTTEPTAEPITKPRRRALPTIGFAAAASIAMTLAVVFAVTNLGQAGQTSVAAPPPLVTTPLGDDLGEVLAGLAERARAETSPATSTQTIRLETWSVQVDADSPVSPYYVQPEEIEKVWLPDHSGTWRSWAGDIRYGTAPTGDNRVAPGTTLRDDAYAAGEFPLSYPEAPPDDALELDSYIRSAGDFPGRPEAFEYFWAIEGMRFEWSLTGTQTAAALDLLAELPEVTLAGSVTDRLGREGIAIETERDGGTHRMFLIFSPETGLLLSSETVYLGGIPDNALEYPTVLNYFAWKD
jgi:hypothetical protein